MRRRATPATKRSLRSLRRCGNPWVGLLSLSLLLGITTFVGCIHEEEDLPSEVINHVATGDPVPAFTVSDGHGNSFSSEQFIGKRSLLLLFHTDCGDCRRELPKIEQVWQMIQGDDDYQVVAIARREERASIDRYWQANGLTLPTYLDPEREVFDLFANSTIPRLYIINTKGEISWMGIETIVLSAEELYDKVVNQP